MTRFLHILFICSLFAFASGPTFADPVDINQADADTIAANLKGIGLKKAEAIVAHRNAHGPFKAADDLTVVKGIGQGTVEMNRADIRIGSAAQQQ